MIGKVTNWLSESFFIRANSDACSGGHRMAASIGLSDGALHFNSFLKWYSQDEMSHSAS
jgi:hypothetical protein